MEALQIAMEQARSAGNALYDPVRDQLLGFLFYNWSRCLHKAGRKKEAARFWSHAGTNRSIFYRQAKRNGLTDEVVKAAATQVWKIREDWPTFFPDEDIELCGVSEELHAEVAALANPNFSAKP